MPIKDNREYRAVMPFEAVEADNGDCIVEGYATTFDVPYDFGPDGLKEMIRSSAFAETDMSDVIFQYDHSGPVMARTRNNTLAVTLDSHGMHVRANLRGSQQGRDLYEAIKNGLVDRMSWGFIVDPEGWEYESETRTSIISKVAKVFDVSAVSIPANQDTEICARSYFNGVIEASRKEFAKREEEQAERVRLAAMLELTKE